MKNKTKNQETPRTFLPAATAVGVQRAVKTWLNTCPDLPASAGAVTFEDLPGNGSGLTFTTSQSPAYAARYVTGGYKAEYRFRVIYRVLPSDDGDMLDAVEALTAIAAWCETAAAPTLDGAVNVHVIRTSDVTILAAFEDGSNDYSIDLTLTWEVF